MTWYTRKFKTGSEIEQLGIEYFAIFIIFKLYVIEKQKYIINMKL